MCGIAGFVGAGDAADVRRMTEALTHRGPDAFGFASHPERGVWLGHRRLSVVDLEDGGQPMRTADGRVVVVFNGEIYDASELRKELESRGRVFRSHHSDTELLLHGYLEWGPGFVERLNGMWAFALYDKVAGRLLLSRDRFGEKPLYWTQQRQTFAFASELEALTRHARVSRGVSQAAVRKYFAYGYIPAPGSLYEGIHKLPAGYSLSLDLSDARPRPARYWEFRLEPDEAAADRPLEEWEEGLRERLERAVARRLVADVPVGVFLSGGIDSSAVAAFAARRLEAGKLRTYAVGFVEPSFDESRFAERAARRVGSIHRCLRFSMEEARGVLPEVVAGLDEPLGDASLLPTYLLCGFARREVTVALGGDGGDELFAGYDPFRALRRAEWYERLVPRPLHRAIALLAARLPTSHRNISFDFKVKRTLRGLSHERRLWNPVWMGPLAPAELEEIWSEPADLEEVYAEAIETWERCRGASLVDQTLQFFTRLYLADDILAKVDRASMLHSLEVRSPYLDVELVDFVRRMPHALKLRGGQTKFILKRALAKLLPAEIVHRSKKGFGVPIGRWLQEGAPPFDDFAAPQDGARARFLARRLREHRAGRADHRLYLYGEWLLGRILAR